MTTPSLCFPSVQSRPDLLVQRVPMAGPRRKAEASGFRAPSSELRLGAAAGISRGRGQAEPRGAKRSGEFCSGRALLLSFFRVVVLFLYYFPAWRAVLACCYFLLLFFFSGLEGGVGLIIMLFFPGLEGGVGALLLFCLLFRPGGRCWTFFFPAWRAVLELVRSFFFRGSVFEWSLIRRNSCASFFGSLPKTPHKTHFRGSTSWLHDLR